MEANSPRWTEITRSEFPWEREALNFVRERLPDHEPYRAWSNFEFVADDGSINEVDLLVLTPRGFFLVEIKSRPGKVEGDAGTWSWHHDGRIYTDDNPLILANRKAKKLIGLLRRQKSMSKARDLFLEAQVFLSHETNTCQFPDHLRGSVHARDRDKSEDDPGRKGIVAAHVPENAASSARTRVDRPIAKAVTRAMEEAGIRPSKRARRIQDYQLEELLFEGPTYQDWLAKHVSLESDRARVRIYSVEPGASAELRETISAAARRERTILSGIEHEGILKSTNYTESERGPALFFEHFEKAQRLDHYLAERLPSLSVDQRLALLRQIAETVHYAHDQRLIHRALSPQSILVIDPEAGTPRLKILNWQTGARQASETRMTSLGVSATSHVDELIEDASAVYMAPEALAERGSSGEELDVFSLGAVAYHLFSGQPPATSFYELTEKLREDKGLQVSSVLDGAPESLQFLIQCSTHPEVTARLDSATDFLEGLDDVEEELTSPDFGETLPNPIEAKPKDLIEHGYLVKRRLGKGGTALALLVEKDGKERVLKIALEPSHNARLQAEAAVLRKLRHQFIVELHDELTFGDRVGLVMARAGDRTLAQRLREEGRLALELLERFGEDLLQTVDWLDQHGVHHRDIKPENLGVAQVGRGDALHLVLFDFSLAETPDENIRAGTTPYLDPFLSLRKPPRWDTNAERFAAAMTLYQMATGTMPTWGDGQSDPAVLDVEATIDAEAFEPTLRERLTAFFEKALRRDAGERFDNAQEMLAAWRDALATASEPAVSTDHDEQDEATQKTALDDATLETPLVLLGLSTRAINALDRVGAGTVRDLLQIPPPQLSHMRGVGTKTRREIATCFKALAERFPDVERKPVGDARGDSDEAERQASASLGIDALAPQLLPSRVAKNAEPSQNALRVFLRLSPPDGAGPKASGTSIWPSQSEVADEVGVTRARIGQVLGKARKRWLKIPAMTQLREEIVGLLDGAGGVMTAGELAEALLARRGSSEVEPLRTRQALAVARAAIEAERDRANPRWIVRRPHDGGRILVARDELAEDGTPRIDGQRLADYAERLGKEADKLAAADPLLPPDRIAEALTSVAPPAGGPAPPLSRIRQLAAATSRDAALSSRLELYPRKMPAERALKLALGALAGARELTPQQIRERVASRYPDAEPLPERPELDRLLESAGSELRWRTGAAGEDARESSGRYVAPLREFTTVQSGTSFTRSATLAPRFDEVPADEATTRAFQDRLEHALAKRDFLALAVSPKRAVAAERALAARFPLDVRSLDEILIRHMKQYALERKIDWQVVERADAVPPGERSGNRDWNNLLRVVHAVLPRATAEIAEASRPVLLMNLGLLARYERLSVLSDLQSATGREGGAPGLWLLVPSDSQAGQPTLDGHPIPVFTSAQWAAIPTAWLLAQDAAMKAPE